MLPLCSADLGSLVLAFSVYFMRAHGLRAFRLQKADFIIQNIGITLCEVTCIENGFCFTFEYNNKYLICRLSGSNTLTKREGCIVRSKNHSHVWSGSCTDKFCSVTSRCLETRAGKSVCVKELRERTILKNEVGWSDEIEGRTEAIMTTRKTVQLSSGRRPTHDVSEERKFHAACREGKLNQVKRILSDGRVHVNNRGQYRRTALIETAMRGHKHVFDYLISKGADMTLYADHRENVLKAACFGGNVEIVKHVLSQKVLGINSRGAYRQTPLMEAASRGHPDVFDVLIKANADVSLVDEHGNNILHLACLYGQEEMVNYLLSKDYVDIDTKNSRGKTAAMIAKEEGHKAVYDLFKSKSSERD